MQAVKKNIYFVEMVGREVSETAESKMLHSLQKSITNTESDLMLLQCFGYNEQFWQPISDDKIPANKRKKKKSRNEQWK